MRAGRELDSKHVATLGGGSVVFVVATSACLDANGNTVKRLQLDTKMGNGWVNVSQVGRQIHTFYTLIHK